MKRLPLLTLLLASLASVFTACRKNRYDKSKAPVVNAIVENAFSEMTNMTDQAINGGLVFYKSGQVIFTAPNAEEVFQVKTPCNVIVTVDTLSSPKSITIDWGTTNCDCNDGKQRRGKIVTTFTGPYRQAGTVITHTPVGYYVNDHKIEGTKVVTNMGLNSSNQPYFNVEINGVATLSSGEVVNYTSSRVRTWIAGSTSLLNYFDDEYTITGTADAEVVNGDSYTAQVTSPLHIKVGCGYITKGTLEITPSGKPTRTIDYGDGSCDATFTITVNGNTYTING